jgi:hypothetical protein
MDGFGIHKLGLQLVHLIRPGGGAEVLSRLFRCFFSPIQDNTVAPRIQEERFSPNHSKVMSIHKILVIMENYTGIYRMLLANGIYKTINSKCHDLEIPIGNISYEEKLVLFS